MSILKWFIIGHKTDMSQHSVTYTHPWSCELSPLSLADGLCTILPASSTSANRSAAHLLDKVL